jgi:general transcription factor 3C polypeptide 3 (transcription factor C subunit 4)
LKEIDSAVTAFSHVVEMAPSHVGARMSLAMLHQQQGKHDEALKALSPGKLFIHFLHSPSKLIIY